MDTDRILEIHRRLAAAIDETAPLLIFDGAFQLLVSVILSAQTTDEQVNRVTPELFSRFPSPDKMATAPIAELEELVHTTGFFRNKARNIRGAAQALVERFDARVPEGIDELTSLPGVGRKSANVIRGAWFGKPAIIVDTHFGRVVRRLDLARESNPAQVEREIGTMVPEESQYRFSMLVNRHGRVTCRSRTPLCGGCVLRTLCRWPETDRVSTSGGGV